MSLGVLQRALGYRAVVSVLEYAVVLVGHVEPCTGASTGGEDFGGGGCLDGFVLGGCGVGGEDYRSMSAVHGDVDDGLLMEGAYSLMQTEGLDAGEKG
eukprot:CAMPEP_0194417446 /NCGR_PEP_ID=MMETSP0176-20130528/16545_1 /TAXON_ID=216777 /ORGANISM="Proboscia alata, Strain PI-D3" /LENGTH=97 /DNA_ID=CAMNT_0039223351 /DNA_START=135 /DNA_END=428 /DNA_ORIENTATION=+